MEVPGFGASAGPAAVTMRPRDPPGITERPDHESAVSLLFHPGSGRLPQPAGSFVLPADSGDEARWLVAEINLFLKSVAAGA